jgi:diguanylate cyclase (GGDEF)-like protein
MDMLNSTAKIQSFIIIIRWVVLLVGPLLFSVRGMWPQPFDIAILALFALVTVLISLCQVTHYNPSHNHWIIIHIIDLISISLIIFMHGGINSEAFNLYYLFILQAGLVFGVRPAICCLIASSLLYCGVVLINVPSDEDFTKLILRIIYSWLIGVTSVYLAYQEKLHHNQAIIDNVTSIYNRRFLEQCLIYEFKKARRLKSSFSIIMIDIDNFKTVNDLYGHQTGDMVLEKVAAMISHTIREIDFVARYGGEEFIVILPGIGTDKASEIAERIRKAVEKVSFNRHKDDIVKNVTVSCGVASYPAGAETIEDLLKIADDFLYEAKRAGRNRVFYKAG